MQRRVSVRRGSASALDPFNVHTLLNHNPTRVSSSTLTIVRVGSTQVPSPSVSLHEPPSSPVLGQRRLHRRPGPTSAAPASSQSPPEPPPPARLSFAFSSFSGSSPPSGGSSTPTSKDRAPDPSSSPRLRPSSPRISTSKAFSTKPRLSPEQLVDLARQSTSPRGLAQAAATAHSAPTSPAILSHSPILAPHTSASQRQLVAPTTFTPLPDDVYLPFIDRPSEVASLISIPPDAKLFALLAQTLGMKKDSDPDTPLEQPSDLPTDPSEWSYRHLVFHLTKVDRDVAPDTIWAYAARKCIISHSELIWERVKGALGIPPELDIDWDFNRSESDNDSIRTEDISEDEGRAAHGHWSDWDAIMDSPVFDRKGKRLSMDSFSALARQEQHGITIGNITPPSSVEDDAEFDNQIAIEPLIAPPTSSSNPPPPLSLPSALSTGPSDGLGDIAEGAEEEEDAEGASKEPGTSLTQGHFGPSSLSFPQIQGLKISTAPLPLNHYDRTPPTASPISPVLISGPFSGSMGGGNPSSIASSGPQSRSGSFSSVGPFRKTESTGSMAALLSSWRSAHKRAGSDASSVLSELHLGGDSIIGDYRTAGNPLFPSNFARLASAPTLKHTYVFFCCHDLSVPSV